jgi:predicted Zn-dependent protease
VQRGELSPNDTGLQACVAAGHPQAALILKTLAAAAMQALRYHAAKDFLDRWEKIDPLNPTLHEWRGWVFDRLNIRDGAMEAYRKCLELDPDRVKARLHLAELLLETVQPREVAQHLDRLRQWSTDDPEVLLVEARYRDLVGESETARVLADRLLDQKPHQLPANLLRANLELKEDRPAAAEAFVRRGLAARPYDYVANYTLLRCLTLLGKSDEAAAQMAKVDAIQRDQKRLKHLIVNELESAADKTEVMHEIGAALFRIGEDERALDWLYRTLELDPDHQATHRLLVDYYEKLGDRDKADQHRQRLKS